MPGSSRSQGARAIVLVAITYVYFLIFAQFGFLARLDALNLTTNNLQLVMATMAASGIVCSLITPFLELITSVAFRLQLGLGLSALAALLSLLRLGASTAALVSLLIGAGLGILTVTLVTHLRAIAGQRAPILTVGIGTGFGYFICNFPPLFTATPEHQAIAAALLCVLGIFFCFSLELSTSTVHAEDSAPFSFLGALLGFAALVWLDSAAFYIIQHVPLLKAGTWMGNVHLWTNGFIHLVAAICAALLLSARRVTWVLALAFGCLAAACLLLHDPASSLSASLFYPAGVSLYSVALVAYPSFLTNARTVQQRATQAGILYAVAGWIGSALGVGMGQNLGHIPTAFIVVAGMAVLMPIIYELVLIRWREFVVVCSVVAAAYALNLFFKGNSRPVSVSSIERGRQIYIAEGCIHCHSQFVRPGTPDVLMWGPVESLAEIHRQHPPLIGNRRQGPDLAQVGGRRSSLWLKAHLIDPDQVSGGSIMPSYAFLFRDTRGNDLVAYLASLHSNDVPAHVANEQAWLPEIAAKAQADASEGEHLYRRHCATCHDAAGATRRKWQSEFKEQPINLFTQPFKYVKASSSPDQRYAQLARTTKFGIPDTDMPGHEYLSDRDIASLTLWLMQHSTSPAQPQF